MIKNLNASDRRSLITDIVHERGKVTVQELREQFNITETSVWRDLRLLEQSGQIKRIHGGAVVIPGNSRIESFSEKMQKYVRNKERIGKAAAGLIKPNDICLLDSGTTTLQIIKQIPARLRQMNTITLVTNSIPVTHEVLAWSDPDLMLLGGIYLPDYQATVGPQTLEQLRDLAADMVFLGTDGITLEGGITTANILMAEVDRLMVERARHAILVTDSSKFNRMGFVPVASIESFHMIITDTNAPPDLISAIRDKGVEVMLV